MSIDAFIAQAKGLSVDDRMRLIGEVWDSFTPKDRTGPTQAQLDELERRWLDDEANPVEGIPWEVVNAETSGRPIA